jgi:hypothetical protein
MISTFSNRIVLNPPAKRAYYRQHPSSSINVTFRRNSMIKKIKPPFFLPLFGFASLMWFLIRVIPKPSRAAYPCQRVAFPVAAGFVIWLTTVFSSIFLYKNTRLHFRKGRTGYALLGTGLLLIAVGFSFFNSPSIPAFADDNPFTPNDKPNQPMGEAKGIFPGRVVWAHNTAATSWNGSGYWPDDKFTDQAVVNQMMAQSLCDLTGTRDDAGAWDALFRHFNTRQGHGNNGYQKGEKIAIKINLNACNTHGISQNRFYTSPQVTFSVLQQLVEKAGVDPADITFYDATRYVPKETFDKCRARYPSVHFADWEGGDGREKIQRDTSVRIEFSQKLTLEPGGGNPTYVPTCVSQAAYLINIGQLKGHNLAGITINAKNYFGSIISYPADDQPQSSSPTNAGLHPYVCVHSDFHFGGHWDFAKRAMGTYNALVDLMGFEQLGGKTMLFVVDGLYSTPDQSSDLSKDHKWKSFENDWPNSIFMSQDIVAVESVCLDFLRNEPVQTWVRGNVDNYLHEAAQADHPPSGTIYDPEQDGTVLKSLGVHEHWNNATDKKYSRNLATDYGIELVQAGSLTAVDSHKDQVPASLEMIKSYPNPFNSRTTIQCDLPQGGFYTVDIFSITGTKIVQLVERELPAGQFKWTWNGADDSGRVVPSGVYIVHLRGRDVSAHHYMTLIR